MFKLIIDFLQLVDFITLEIEKEGQGKLYTEDLKYHLNSKLQYIITSFNESKMINSKELSGNIFVVDGKIGYELLIGEEHFSYKRIVLQYLY